jgi:phage/plasmid-associated DNA primase
MDVLKSPYINQDDIHGYKNLYRTLLKNNSEITVKYAQKKYSENFYGRLFPIFTDDKMKITPYQWAAVRTHLCSENYVDVDIKNCQPTILEYLCRVNNIDCPTLKAYVKNRDRFFDTLDITGVDVERYNLKTYNNVTLHDFAKHIFNMTFFGAGVDKICQDLCLSKTPFLSGTLGSQLRGELKDVTKAIIDLPIYQQLIRDYTDEKAKKNEHVHPAGCLSMILQTREAEYVLALIKTFRSAHFTIGSYLYDGCLVSKVGKTIDSIQKILDRINADLPVHFIIKPWKQSFMDLDFTTVQRTEEDITRMLADLNEGDTDNIFDILPYGPSKTGDYIKEEIAKQLKFDGTWFYFQKDTFLWRETKHPHKIIVNHIHGVMDKYLNDIGYAKDDYISNYNHVDSSAFKSGIIDHFKTELETPDFRSKLNVLQDCLPFRDGVLNMQTMEFREGLQWDDFLTDTLPYNYPRTSTAEAEAFIMNKFRQINNDNAEHLDFYFRLIGYSMTGRASEQQLFFNLIGPLAGNGKSVGFETLMMLFPMFTAKLTGNAFLEGNKKAHKDLSKIQNKRIIWTEEFPQSNGINESLIKELANGTYITNEVMYGTTEKINIYGKAFILSNYTPKFKSDGGMARRFIQLNFNSKFIDTGKLQCAFEDRPNKNQLEYPMDKQLGYKFQLPENRDAFVRILIRYAHLYYTEGLPIPAYVMANSKETCEMNDNFKTFFDEYFDLADDWTSRTEVQSIWKTNMGGRAIDAREIKDGLAKIGKFQYDPKKRFDAGCGGFHGFRVRKDIAAEL